MSEPARDLPTPAAAEIDAIEAEILRFIAGETSPERFRAFRLAHGIYGQRQPGVQMVRVKIPAGIVRASHLSLLADLADDFSNGVAHLTTRQDVQLHYVPLPKVAALLRRLAAGGLTTREACGNSVRNVTACPLSGALGDEAFDVRPYALATSAYLLRNAFCQQMARKFKIAFSACPEDCAATAIHDIGFAARLAAGDDGRPRRGFAVVVGGGLGATPFVARTLEEFVPAAEILPVVRAILQVFADHGNRRLKMKARLKFVVQRLGIDRFREQVQERLAAHTPEERAEAALAASWPAPPVAAALEPAAPWTAPRAADVVPQTPVVAARVAGPAARPWDAASPRRWAPTPLKGACDAPAGDAAFHRFLSANVRPHRDAQRAIVTVLVPLGDLRSADLRALAGIVARHGGDEARIARDQDLVLPSVRRADLRAVHAALREAGLAEAGAGTALDVTSCPGADTCALGITSSKGLARALRDSLAPLAANGGLETLRGASIKISGCPNSCGQHHVASIGLHGVARTIAGRQVPAYQIHLGGAVGPAKARIGDALDKIPARRVPAAVAALLGRYAEERAVDEPFAAWCARRGRESLKAVVAPFAEAGPQDADLGVDWGGDAPFTTDDIGAGECAGAGQDKMEDPFGNVRADLEQADRLAARGQWSDAAATLGRARYALARVLLEALGRKPDSDYETACELRARVIDRGHCGEAWNEWHESLEAILRRRAAGAEEVRAARARAEGVLLEAVPLLNRLRRIGTGAGSTAEIPG